MAQNLRGEEKNHARGRTTWSLTVVNRFQLEVCETHHYYALNKQCGKAQHPNCKEANIFFEMFDPPPRFAYFERVVEDWNYVHLRRHTQVLARVHVEEQCRTCERWVTALHTVPCIHNVEIFRDEKKDSTHLHVLEVLEITGEHRVIGRHELLEPASLTAYSYMTICI